MLGLATTYFLENKNDEALTSAQTALAADPTEPRLNLLVGEILTTRGDYPGAELAFEEKSEGGSGVASPRPRAPRTLLASTDKER